MDTEPVLIPDTVNLSDDHLIRHFILRHKHDLGHLRWEGQPDTDEEIIAGAASGSGVSFRFQKDDNRPAWERYHEVIHKGHTYDHIHGDEEDWDADE